MLDRRVVRVGAVVWAIIGFLTALSALGQVNADARLLVGAASVIFPLAAVLAGNAIASHHDRTAGLLLLVSVATPTYFAWVINVPALLAGLALLTLPAMVIRPRRLTNPA